MINYSEIQKHEELGWDSYLSLPGYSYSFFKNERHGLARHVETTEAMARGTMVDNILTGGRVDMASPLYIPARDIASKITGTFGSLITRFEKQISYSALCEYKGFKVRMRGRLDFLLTQRAVIDLKVTGVKDVGSVIDFFGYKNQVWHYARMAQVPKAYLMIYSVPKRKTEIIEVDVRSNMNEFFAEKIIKFGTHGE